MSATEQAGAVRHEGRAASTGEAFMQSGASDHRTEGQPAEMTPEDRIAARRAEIARRSNEYYQHRARATARQNRRTMRIALFVCAVVVLAAAAFAAPLILNDRGVGYFGNLLWPAEETRIASLSGSGSVYMLPAPPAREPQAPPVAEQSEPAVQDKPAATPIAITPAAPLPVPDVIQPAGEATLVADPGLLYEEATGNTDKPAAAEPVASKSPEPAAVLKAEPQAPADRPTVVAALDPATEKADADIEPQNPASATSMLKAEEARGLLERGDRLMQLGDIVSARAFYVRALEANRPGAALRLGSTFDPLIYRRMGVQGLKPDTKVALEWYLTAAEAGNADGRRAYDALKSHSGQ
jgi:hypothetical protein